MTRPPPIPLGDVAPVLLVSNIHRAVAWYVEKLGFAVEQLWGEPPGFAMATLNGATIMLKQSPGGPRENGASLKEMWDVYIWVKDAKATRARLQEGGVKIVRGPTMQDYGCEEVEVKDPDGHIICFGACN